MVNSDYGYSWSWQRDKCLARDNYSCQICDKKQKEGYRLCIHHIIPYTEFGSNYGCLGNWPHHKKANRLRNLICLCSSCHGKVHGNNHEKNKKFLQLIANINTKQFLREEKQTFTNNIRSRSLSPSLIEKIIAIWEWKLQRNRGTKTMIKTCDVCKTEIKQFYIVNYTILYVKV